MTFTGKKETTISELRANKSLSEVFVINNTANIGSKDSPSSSGIIIISISLGNEEPVPVKVPDTWIPIDISMHVPIDALLSSNLFLRAVRTNVVKLITSDYAHYLLSTKEAEAELDRLAVDSGSVRPSDNKVQEPIKSALQDIYPPLIRIMNNTDYREAERISAIKNIAPRLKLADWAFILAKTDAEETQLKEYALQESKK